MAATASPDQIVLVPGFFGFTNLGELPYFAHVEQVLQASAGRSVGVSVVSTDPTASLPYRAARLAEHVRQLMNAGGQRFHLVGHSSGGLDARLMVTPAVSLPTTVDVEACARKVRSVVCVTTPHRGTPAASFFAGRMGQSLLQVFSLCSIAILRRGRVPVVALLRLAGLIDRVRSGRRPNPSAVARLHDQLLADFSPERQTQLESFLTQVQTDQGLLPQLTPEGLEVFNASTPDRPGVRYGSVVAWGRPPSVSSAFKAGLDPYAQATHSLYSAVHRLSRGMPGRRANVRAPGQDGLLGAAYGVVPGWDATDGMVPTRSQVWGELLHATVADHLDVVGYFSDPAGNPPHYDWLASASGFDRGRFEALWGDVARFMLEPGRVGAAAISPRVREGILPAPTDWAVEPVFNTVEETPVDSEDRLVSPAEHRRWVLGRFGVWATGVLAGVVVQPIFPAGWAVLAALGVVGVGDAWYRRRFTVRTVLGPARYLSSFPPRYLLWPSGRIVRLVGASERPRLTEPDDP